MPIFHQNSHQLNTQIKVFPVRLSDLQLFNGTFDENSEYQFADYGDAFGGFSYVAFLPVFIIGVLLAILVFFLKLRNLRMDREQLDRLEHVYRVLECVDQVEGDAFENPELVRTIQSVLLPDDDSEQTLASSRKNSFFQNEYRFKLKNETFCELDHNSKPHTRIVVEVENNQAV